MSSSPDMRDLISDYLDGRTHDREMRDQFEHRLNNDPQFRREFELVASARSAVRMHADDLHFPVPDGLLQGIRAGLRDTFDTTTDEVQTNATVHHLPFSKHLGRRWSLVASIAAAAIAITYWLASPVPDAALDMVDIYSGAYSNFTAVQRGELRMSYQGSDTNSLSRFFREQGVTHDVVYPHVRGQLVGGVVSHHKHIHCAHLMYKYEGKVVYIFQVDSRHFDHSRASLPRHILSGISTSKYYVEQSNPVGTLLVWKRNNVVCSAVSNLNSSEFAALLDVDK